MSFLKKLARKARGSPPSGPRLFHYTTGQRFNDIARDREIALATAELPEGEKATAWFSFHPDWEPTANKAVIEPATGRRRGLTREETASLAGGLVRIEIRPGAAPHDWDAYVRLSGVHPRFAAGMRTAALEAGSDPRLWRVSFEPVGMTDWLSIELFEGDGWRMVAEGNDEDG